MFDAQLTDSYVAQPLNQLPNDIAEEARREGYRPTIKALIALRQRRARNHPVATYETVPKSNPAARLLNLPGGGARQHESWMGALSRELLEELQNVRVTTQQLQQAPILAMDSVSSNRPRYRGKLLVIVGLLLPAKQFTTERLQPTGKEIRNLSIGTICEAAGRLRQLSDTKPETAEVYRGAFTQLRIELSR